MHLDLKLKDLSSSSLACSEESDPASHLLRLQAGSHTSPEFIWATCSCRSLLPAEPSPQLCGFTPPSQCVQPRPLFNSKTCLSLSLKSSVLPTMRADPSEHRNTVRGLSDVFPLAFKLRITVVSAHVHSVVIFPFTPALLCPHTFGAAVTVLV